ncbi:MAG: response regulator [Elusimicrobiales bacterium]|jgi:CheY-like chemotaxis protein
MAKILVIDDDGIVRDALSVFLTRAGHEVLTSVDGANGLLVFKNAAPDLVLLDRDLPVMSGSEVLAGIRKTGSRAKVVILTGFDDSGDAERYLKAGATSFLSKGDGLSNVISEIEKLLGPDPRQAGRQVFQSPSAGAASGGPAVRGGKVLVADDDANIREVLCRFLSSEGYTAVPAFDGADALAVVEKENPDIVLLDISMPVKSGVEVLQELARSRPEIGVVMITGNEDEELARACLKNGAFDYLSKPISLVFLGTILRARMLVQKNNN